MEVSHATPAVSPSSATPVVAGKSQGSGKAIGKDSAFHSLLQSADDDTAPATNDDSSQASTSDPLQTMLAALNSGLTPLMMALPMQPQLGTSQSTAGDAVQALTLTIGNQMLQLNPKNLPISNGDLATLLQKFGASPALMRVLLAQPQGQLSASLAAHPEVIADLEKALNNVAQQVTQTPALLADPKLANLMQSILSDVRQQQSSSSGEQQSQPGKQQQPAMISKLQVAISTHAVEMVATDAKQPEVEQPAQQTALSANNLLVNAQVQFPSQPLNHLAQPEANVVLVQADKFNTEFADLVVKRAALIESPGRQEFRIVLQPQGLGEIEVRVQAEGNQISLHFTADNAASKSLLDSGLSNLKNSLQAQGIQFDRIEVSSSNLNNNSSAFSGMPQERGSGQNFKGQQGQQSSTKRDNRSFTIDGIDALGELVADVDSMEQDGIDVTA